MRIDDQIGAKAPIFSFEFFPPKTAAGEEALYRTIEGLKGLRPTYVSITYGAGGSTRTKTVELARQIKGAIGIEVMAHLTCVDATREEVGRVLDELHAAGIENVLPLRGDPPRDRPAREIPADEGFGHASSLVRFIRERGVPFCLAGACYPEGHVECKDLERDADYLLEKVNAGVNFLITQLFFDNADYFSFVERARRRGITIPVIPGIMPVTNVAQLERFTLMCGAAIPSALRQRLTAVADNDEAVRQIGIDHALAQCRDLLAKGAPGVHFYTLNQSGSTRAILEQLTA